MGRMTSHKWKRKIMFETTNQKMTLLQLRIHYINNVFVSKQLSIHVANFYVSYPFQSLVVKKWRHSQLYLEQIKLSTLINKCPGFPGNSWQKELAKKKRAQIQRTQICSLPPPPLQLTWK